MGAAVGPALAAAVSNAGGLGALWGADVPRLRQLVRETRALTAKPFAVNLNLEFPQEERLAACLEEGVPVISFFWRDPSDLVARAKSGGATVLHTVSTAAEARDAAASGVDAVVAQGWEAGDHVRVRSQRCHSFQQWSMRSDQFPSSRRGALPTVAGLLPR